MSGLIASTIVGVGFLLAGCTSYTTVTCRVLDIETREPIANAVVSTGYAVPFSLFPPPKPDTQVSDENGSVRLRVAQTTFLVFVRCEAKGFAPGQYVTEHGAHIEAGFPPQLDLGRALAGSREPWPQRFVIEKWRDASPVFVVTVPSGFRGKLRIVPDVGHVMDLEPGQRQASLRLNPDGTLLVPLTRPILIGLYPDNWAFRFEDGPPLQIAVQGYDRRTPATVPDNVTAVRQITANSQLEFFIGTEAELRQSAQRSSN